MPKFSVIIPCFNSERHVGEAIRSALGQTEADLEVIVVDDGSTDGSPAQIASAAADPRVHVIRETNRGVGAARNAGLAAARGEYVNFLDADDVLAPEKLARQGRVLDANPAVGLVLCDGFRLDQDGNRLPGGVVELWRLAGSLPLFTVLFSNGQFPPVVPLVRRTLAQQVGGMAETREQAGWADTGFWLKVALACPSYHVVPEALCGYRTVPGSMSTDSVGMERAAVEVYASLMRTYPEACARALRMLQGRLGDIEFANYQLRTLLASGPRGGEPGDAGRAAELARRNEELATAVRGAAGAGRPLLVWGAGGGGRRVLRLVAALGGKVTAVIDSDPAKAGSLLEGVGVLSPSGLSGQANAYVLLATVHGDAVRPRLEFAGLVRGRDYHQVDFEALAAWEARVENVGAVPPAVQPEPAVFHPASVRP